MNKELFKGEDYLHQLEECLKSGGSLSPIEWQHYHFLKKRKTYLNAGGIRGQRQLC